MIKNFVVAMMCCTGFIVHAQNGTVSPYSYFGIGDLRSNGSIENQMMGGISMYGDSIHINIQNPAAYAKLGLMTYTVAVSHKEFRLKTFNEEQNSSVTNIDYLAIGLPLSKGFGLGFGLMPYTSVGYNLVSERLNADQATVTNQLTGEGGLNRFFLSAGYKLTKDLSIGVTGNFNFGTLSGNRIQSVENILFGTADRKESRVNGFDFNYALNYNPSVKGKYTLFSSVLVNTQGNLTSENTQEIGSFSLSTGQNIEVLNVNLDAQGLRYTELKIPTTTTLGLGFGQDKKWFVGAEYSFQGFSNFSNDFLRLDNLTYQDASSISLGGYFIPDYTSFTSYAKRVTYRAGIRNTKTGMVVNNKEINNFGITFGMGLPLGVDFSNLNLGLEVGRRGTTDAALIEETYFKVNLGLSLNDRWFIKRKIN